MRICRFQTEAIESRCYIWNPNVCIKSGSYGHFRTHHPHKIIPWRCPVCEHYCKPGSLFMAVVFLEQTRTLTRWRTKITGPYSWRLMAYTRRITHSATKPVIFGLRIHLIVSPLEHLWLTWNNRFTLPHDRFTMKREWRTSSRESATISETNYHTLFTGRRLSYFILNKWS